MLSKTNVCMHYSSTLAYLDELNSELQQHVKDICKADMLCNGGICMFDCTFDNLHFTHNVAESRSDNVNATIVKTTAFTTHYSFPINADNTQPVDIDREHLTRDTMQASEAEYILLHYSQKVYLLGPPTLYLFFGRFWVSGKVLKNCSLLSGV
jgi:spore coat protein U-like protein